MAQSPDHRSPIKRLAGRSLARVIGLVERTSTMRTDPPDLLQRLAADHPLILACWHGQFMMLSVLRPKGARVKAMVARHGDADLIGEAMQALGVELIRGAGAGGRRKDRGGAAALRGAVGALEEGASVVMTADVPPGPARRAGEGIIAIARLSGRPIVPVAAATSRFKALDTWSRMTINLPYSKLAYAAGPPLLVPRDLDADGVERYRLALEQSLNAATERAYALAGADVARIAPRGLPCPDAPVTEPGLGLKVYRAATRAFEPAATLLLKLRERQGKEDPGRRGERFGIAGAARPEGRLVWCHAASVGEANAVLPLIDALTARRPELSFLLTTGTVTSAGLAARRLGANAIHQYVPLDVARYAARFLDHWRPDLAVFTESEIWPNLVLETARRGVPLALVNARMSPRSYKRWRKRPRLAAPLFARFDLVLAQNDKLARWFQELGARRVLAVGNLKIDAPPPPVDLAELEALRAAIAGRPTFVAASTHEGEELIVAAAHRRLARDLPGLLTIVAPRHPERGTQISEQLKAEGFKIVQRSLHRTPAADTDIYVADTIGELGTLYSLAGVAFLGGSLIDRGGQNPIEAVRHGAAVLTGPSWSNFKDAYAALIRHGGAIEVKDAAEMAAALARLAGDRGELTRMQSGAEAALATLAGALERTADALDALLPGDDERLRRAS
ncbi:MAG: glycosyltransferase N-terminal domain-containing protein [Pseudomonadota bacterium]